MNNQDTPECYRVMRDVWTQLNYTRPTGEKLWSVKFYSTDLTVVATSDALALAMAKQLGVVNPILQRKQHE